MNTSISVLQKSIRKNYKQLMDKTIIKSTYRKHHFSFNLVICLNND